MTEGIFISYRRDDSRHAAGRLADDLAEAFGAGHIFRDIEGIELGLDFKDSLEKALASCSVMLVLIGRSWLDVRDAKTGGRRLDHPDDWIRQEIATALQRRVRVVPVLLEGTALPAAADLPEDLRPLVRRQAMELSDVRWRGDLQRLVDTLGKLPGFQRIDRPVPLPSAAPPPASSPPTAAPAKSRKSLWIGVGAVLLVLAMISTWLDEGEDVPFVPAAVQGFPSGYGMRVCGCWGANPAPTAPEPLCASGAVRVNVCAGECAPGHPPYAYVCQ